MKEVFKTTGLCFYSETGDFMADDIYAVIENWENTNVADSPYWEHIGGNNWKVARFSAE